MREADRKKCSAFQMLEMIDAIVMDGHENKCMGHIKHQT